MNRVAIDPFNAKYTITPTTAAIPERNCDSN
jgi:hypothetical protein